MPPSEPYSYPLLRASHILYRGEIDVNALQPLSSASLQASRLCANSDGSFTFATASSVFHVHCEPTRKRYCPDSGFDGDGDIFQPDAAFRCENEAVTDDFLVPNHRFSSLTLLRDKLHSAHDTEVQALSNSQHGSIASVDAYGRCVVTWISTRDEKNALNSRNCYYTLSPASRYDGMPAWAGVCFLSSPSGDFGVDKHVVVVREMFRDISFYDGEIRVRTIHTVQPPQAIKSLSQNTIAVAEKGDICLYDLRSDNTGPSLRKQISRHINSPLFCLDINPTGKEIATAGAERVVHLLDIRAGLSVRDRWSGCLKHECAGVSLSSSVQANSKSTSLEDSGFAYVCSSDNEVACGAINSDAAKLISKGRGSYNAQKMMSGANARSARRAFGFRADLRVTGMARRCMDGAEDVAVVTESTGFYLLRSVCENGTDNI